MNDQLQGQSTLTAGTGVFVVVAILLLFLLPRKYAIVPYLLMSLFIPNAQLLMVGGLHFMIFRMMLPFAWVRVLMGADGDRDEEIPMERNRQGAPPVGADGRSLLNTALGELG